ncbi:ATP-binding protein [Nocardioides sp. GY 10127]|uniref:ATP-binding protein n=1 Tax=Nocardioides sp. GY 10127 TaxID=2569762 RepID=UPI0010A76743|nr:ATP-binding protein [Nocardioides sp. GY 10127]TIC81754.1 HAMP domain-containing histidine kinase [Nocardioides sp. GY 10127]
MTALRTPPPHTPPPQASRPSPAAPRPPGAGGAPGTRTSRWSPAADAGFVLAQAIVVGLPFLLAQDRDAAVVAPSLGTGLAVLWLALRPSGALPLGLASTALTTVALTLGFGLPWLWVLAYLPGALVQLLVTLTLLEVLERRSGAPGLLGADIGAVLRALRAVTGGAVAGAATSLAVAAATAPAQGDHGGPGLLAAVAGTALWSLHHAVATAAVVAPGIALAGAAGRLGDRRMARRQLLDAAAVAALAGATVGCLLVLLPAPVLLVVLPPALAVCAALLGVGRGAGLAIGTLGATACTVGLGLTDLGGAPGPGRFGLVDALVMLCVIGPVAAALLGQRLRDLALREHVWAADRRALRTAFLGATASLRDAVLTVDADHRIDVANQAARALLRDCDRDARALSSALTQLDGRRLRPSEDVLRRAWELGSSGPSDLLLHHADGTTSVVRVRAHRVDGGAERRLVVAIADLSDQSRACADRERAMRTAAGELRRPLAETRSWVDVAGTQLVEDCEAETRARRSLVRAEDALGRLEQVIDDLLADAGAMARVPAPRRVELGGEEGLVPAVAARYAPEALVVVDEHVPAVLADPDMLQQLLRHLLRSAADNVAPDVRPVVRVAGTFVGDRVHLTVTDNGTGVPLSWQTGPGQGGEPSPALTVCRTVVERHGGTLRCSLAPEPPVAPEPGLAVGGPGARVLLDLPAVPGEPVILPRAATA